MRQVTYQGESTSGISQELWKGPKSDFVAFHELFRDGVCCKDDFLNAQNDADWGGWSLLTGDTGASVAPAADEITGVLELITGGTDNNEVAIQSQGGVGVCAVISDADGAKYPLWFEARIKFAQITAQNWLIGLGEPGMQAADGCFTDAGALADQDFIGFRILEGAPSELDFVYRIAGQAEQVVINDVQTLVADTWYKVGFRYQPEKDDDKQIAIYVDNVEQDTYVTATNIAAATFPDAEELSIVAGGKTGAAASKTMSIDWVHFAQSKDSE